MKLLRHATVLFLALMLGAGCSQGPAKPAGNGGSGAGGAPAQNAAKQDPDDGKTLLQVLLERREGDDPIYVADNVKKPESQALTALKAELKKRELKFIEPGYPNYNYYLNRVIPVTRRRGRVWLVFDHKLEELSKMLKEGYLDLHRVDYLRKFDDATLALVSNDFEAEQTAYTLEPVVARGSTTSNVAFTPDGRYLLVTSKGGVIRWQETDGKRKGLALRMKRTKQGEDGLFAGGESGMIGMALHPDFANNSKIYLHYNWREADGERNAWVSEWRVDMSKAPNEIKIVDERRFLQFPQVHDNHNAGALAFGPDGYLYIAIGDGEAGKWTIGRSPAEGWRGKILRIDVDKRDEGLGYGVPADNPFVGKPPFPPETWAWGFRNPWRLAFMPDGRLIASDIGEDVNEELTFVVKGRHHGWPYYEGAHVRNKWTLDAELQPPLLPYGREYGMSVICGNVYEGKLLPELVGKYVFCDYMSGRIWAFDLPSSDVTLSLDDAEELVRWPMLLPTIAKSPDGELYFGTHTGEVMRLARGDGAAETESTMTKADPAAARATFRTRFAGPKADDVTPARIALGARLFADARLSSDGKRSCATCHSLDTFGQDGKAAVAGNRGPGRNVPSLFHASEQYAQFRDFRVSTLEEAAVESLSYHMGNKRVDQVVERLKGEDFSAAFPGAAAPTVENIGAALGAFLRQLKTTSRWDRFLDGDDAALTDEELVGLNQFLQSGCTTCHMYRGLGGGMPQKLGIMKPWKGRDRGRAQIDETPGQEYFFKIPTLYNVTKTGPYYHDGSMKTLEQAVSNMAEIQLGRQLNGEQVKAIVTFLRALEGEPVEVPR